MLMAWYDVLEPLLKAKF